MVGRTLTEIRRELERLATADGRYYLRCGRTGDRPVPVNETRFPDRQTAADAARIAHAYRATLRRYDPRAPCYDFVVCEADANVPLEVPQVAAHGADRSHSQALIRYCHDLAGAVFEALSAGDHDAVERAVMDTYLSAAERTPDRDRLCLRLLAAMATELDSYLDVEQQATVVDRAAEQLPEAPVIENPIQAALDALRRSSLVDSYEIRDRSGTIGDADWSRTVELTGYELPVDDGFLPALPLAVEVRRRAAGPLAVARAVGRDDGWLVKLSGARTPAAGLAGVPVADRP